MWLLTALSILLVLVCLLGIALTLLQLPGNWLILGSAAAFAWFAWTPPNGSDPVIGWLTLAGLLALALTGEALETLLAGLASRKAGGTRRGAVLAIALGLPGAILGSIFIPIPIAGTLIGAALGAAAGSLLGDTWARQPLKQSTKAARGAAVGKLTGSAAKLAVALAMTVLIITSLLF